MEKVKWRLQPRAILSTSSSYVTSAVNISTICAPGKIKFIFFSKISKPFTILFFNITGFLHHFAAHVSMHSGYGPHIMKSTRD